MAKGPQDNFYLRKVSQAVANLLFQTVTFYCQEVLQRSRELLNQVKN